VPLLKSAELHEKNVSYSKKVHGMFPPEQPVYSSIHKHPIY